MHSLQDVQFCLIISPLKFMNTYILRHAPSNGSFLALTFLPPDEFACMHIIN